MQKKKIAFFFEKLTLLGVHFRVIGGPLGGGGDFSTKSENIGAFFTLSASKAPKIWIQRRRRRRLEYFSAFVEQLLLKNAIKKQKSRYIGFRNIFRNFFEQMIL